MIHPTTKVHWMDVESKIVRHSDVMLLFQNYAHLAIKKDVHISEVSFHNSDHVKITDLYGWTAIKAIRRVENSRQWCTIIADNTDILTTRSTLIPVFDPYHPYPGFHGETKYPFEIKLVSDLIYDDKIRIRDGSLTPDGKIEFVCTHVLSSDMESGVGYEIITRSKFFNADNIYMYGRDPNI